jgi:hypothetical protein
MATGKHGGVDVPFLVRGVHGGWRDWFDVENALEVAAARLNVATADAVTQRIAAEWQRQEKCNRTRR